jgi:hypothetical protein
MTDAFQFPRHYPIVAMVLMPVPGDRIALAIGSGFSA